MRPGHVFTLVTLDYVHRPVDVKHLYFERRSRAVVPELVVVPNRYADGPLYIFLDFYGLRVAVYGSKAPPLARYTACPPLQYCACFGHGVRPISGLFAVKAIAWPWAAERPLPRAVVEDLLDIRCARPGIIKTNAKIARRKHTQRPLLFPLAWPRASRRRCRSALGSSSPDPGSQPRSRSSARSLTSADIATSSGSSNV